MHSPPARFAFTRLPQTVASEPLARALFALYTSVSERNYETIYVNAEKVVGIVRTPDSIGTDLAAVVSALMSTFIGMPHNSLSLTALDLHT
jgi:COP9 signalosome complex subunit 8